MCTKNNSSVEALTAALQKAWDDLFRKWCVAHAHQLLSDLLKLCKNVGVSLKSIKAKNEAYICMNKNHKRCFLVRLIVSEIFAKMLVP